MQGGAKPRLQLGAAGGSWGHAGCSWKTNVAAAGQEPPRSYCLLRGLGRLIKAKMLKSKRWEISSEIKPLFVKGSEVSIFKSTGVFDTKTAVVEVLSPLVGQTRILSALRLRSWQHALPFSKAADRMWPCRSPWPGSSSRRPGASWGCRPASRSQQAACA